jgi:putative transposase
MQMHLTHSYRIYPNKFQQDFFNSQFGLNRFAWNALLGHMNDLGHFIRYEEMFSFYQKVLKPQFLWLEEAVAQSIQQTLMQLHKSCERFMRSPKTYGRPKFKKKRWNEFCRFPQSVIVNQRDGLLHLPKLNGNPIKIVLERPLPPHTGVTITRNSIGQYHAIFSTKREVKDHIADFNTKHVGIDLGLKDLITTSSGEKILAPKFFRNSEKNISRKQLGLSKKKKGSRGFKRFQRKVARAYIKTKRQRLDFIHKLTTRIANDNEAVAVESLRIQGMVKNHKLAKSVMDASWGLICKQLDYKLTSQGKSFVACGPNFPSTQKCSNSICGFISGPKGKDGLKTRSWTCGFCGSSHDRDTNAARNIAAEGDRVYRYEHKLRA